MSFGSWPMQRKRKAVTDAERAYRKNVSQNKRKAASKRTNERVSAERAKRAEDRRKNGEKIRLNEQALENAARLRYKPS